MLRGAIWRSSFWYVSDLDGQYPPPPAIGEERSVPFNWSPGQLGQRLAVAKCTVGDPAWFATGIPPEANVPDPPPLPACCVLPRRIALGGLLLGGRAAFVPIVQGGLLAGGEAFRTLLGAFGGLGLGGATADFAALAVGGLLIGGEAYPELLDAQGGLLIGGEAYPELLDAQGGLLIGGVQETEPAPYGLGGLWIGGEAQEPMALLYCSLRVSTTLSIPNNATTLIPWDSVEEDPSGMFTFGTPTRITVPVPGVYVVQHQINWLGFAAGFDLDGGLRVNGVDYQTLYGAPGAQPGNSFLGGVALKDMAAGDYFEVYAYQNSGSAANPSISGIFRPSIRVAALAPDPPGGRLLGVQQFTTAGAHTYTPTFGTKAIIAELQAGGGGGAGVASPGAGTGQSRMGSGGGGGGYLRVRLTANFSGAALVVGAGGAGGAAGSNNGTAGQATTFTTTGGSPVTYTAGGGGGGVTDSGGAPPRVWTEAGGGTASGGDLNIPGGFSTLPFALNSTNAVAGGGGDSGMGIGATGEFHGTANASVAGIQGTGYGAGGGGAVVNQSGAAKGGASGTDGIIIIWEYS